jgi:predicted dehydrogenase
VSFAEMSGDHIVEQHVHNLDVANWFIGRPPKSAIGFGGRARRKTGNQFDFFSIDFDYDDGVRIHSMCRQINNTYARVAEVFTGSTGQTWSNEYGKDDIPEQYRMPEMPYVGNPYVQEHVDLINSIRSGDRLNETATVATSTLTGIMGRIAAYTGQLVRWKDLLEIEQSPWYNLTLTPTALDFEAGTVTAGPDDVPPVPGQA